MALCNTCSSNKLLLFLNSERTMDLMLSLKNVSESGLQWCGTSNKLVGKLAPNTSTELALTLLATKPGLQVFLFCFKKG